MKFLRISSLAVCFIALLALAGLTSAFGDEWNKETTVTFNEPVEIPGVVLAPGTYVFRLMDSLADRQIVRVFNKDRTKIYATVIGITDYRLEPTGKTYISFEERMAGAPEAVKAWFYPGDNYGIEFVYPKPRAVELAQANKTHVPW